jgi:hypothetical protein
MTNRMGGPHIEQKGAEKGPWQGRRAADQHRSDGDTRGRKDRRCITRRDSQQQRELAADHVSDGQ